MLSTFLKPSSYWDGIREYSSMGHVLQTPLWLQLHQDMEHSINSNLYCLELILLIREELFSLAHLNEVMWYSLNKEHVFQNNLSEFSNYNFIKCSAFPAADLACPVLKTPCKAISRKPGILFWVDFPPKSPVFQVIIGLLVFKDDLVAGSQPLPEAITNTMTDIQLSPWRAKWTRHQKAQL